MGRPKKRRHCKLDGLERRSRRSRNHEQSRNHHYCGQVYEYLINPNYGLGRQIRFAPTRGSIPWKVNIGTCINPTMDGGQARVFSLNKYFKILSIF